MPMLHLGLKVTKRPSKSRIFIGALLVWLGNHMVDAGEVFIARGFKIELLEREDDGPV